MAHDALLDIATDTAIEAAQVHGINIKAIPAKENGKKITVSDVEKYVRSLKSDGQPEEEVKKPKKNAGLVCVLRIKEGSNVFEVGQPYTGENGAYLLTRGSVKEA